VNYRYFLITLLLLFIFFIQTHAQSKYDSIIYSSDSSSFQKLQCYRSGDKILCYAKPKYFSFVTQVPKTFSWAAHDTFQKSSLPAISAIVTSTVLLIVFDQHITDNSQHFLNNMHVASKTDYKNILSFKLGSSKIPIYEAPRNLNSAIYSIGEGFTSLALSGGLFAYGKIKKDYRSLQTASQIVQAQLTVGLICQTFKRVAGRESPHVSTASGGAWRPFVSFSNFSKHTSRYDAFPSGHLSTLMATATVLISNYPEKKWLKPVAYTITSLVGFAMINNGVHWSSDYPLALGIGYVCGKASVNMNRLIRYQSDHEKNFKTKHKR
jgi:membrane-associated phospholipid phosphatase